ncbi:MAG: hypothetical protein IKR11_09235 [Solobacterium sp.]|nr:hypothetical protein [Solobacterium sp.]
MKQILCIGDSNTYGYDPRSYFGSRYPKEIRWTGLLEKEGCKVINEGQNGLCVPASFQETATSDLIIVMLGTNDLLQGKTAEKTAVKMKHYLQTLKEKTRSAILLICPPHMKYGEWVQTDVLIKESALLAEEYKKIADELQIFFFDSEKWNIELVFDGVHFSEKGHAAFAKGLCSFLSSLSE